MDFAVVLEMIHVIDKSMIFDSSAGQVRFGRIYLEVVGR